MTLQTIGERATVSDPDSAHRWVCPLCKSQSSLYIDKVQATGDFEAHLGGHSIQQAFELIKAQDWLKTFLLIEP